MAGLISDFSEARTRSCPAGFCRKELTDAPSVELAGGVGGLIFPYAAPGLVPVALGLDAPDAGGSVSGQALWAGINSGPSPTSVADGFALRFVDCINTSDYSALTFTVDATNGKLGSCPLRFAANLVEGNVGTFDARPIAESPDLAVVPIEAGSTTLDLRNSPSRTALTGMQWEFTVPGGDVGCSAFFRIDDVRLVR